MNEQNIRMEKGKTIAHSEGQIKRVDDQTYLVNSQSNKGHYEVRFKDSKWTCSCPDFSYRGGKCKHIFGVEVSLTLRRIVEVRRIEPITDITNCRFCGSENIVKDGIRHNNHGDIQKFNCKDCGHYFTVNLGFEKMKHNPRGITTALQLYFTGASLRNTSRTLQLIGVKVSHQTIYNWIKKYTSLMQSYVEKMTPQVSDTWRADEVYIKFKGNMKYLFALLDDETRFWIAQEVANSKDKHDARNLLRMGKVAMGKNPKTLITDGLPAYERACSKVFWTRRIETRTKHIRHIAWKGGWNNNKMERFNGEIRDREKVMRGLKKADTPILTGYQVYHNYVRPHEALDGKTPSEACGIKVEGNNKWMTLIQNATQEKK